MSNLNISRAERLDQYVTRALPTLTRTSAAKLIEEGHVTVNSKPNLKAGYKLRENDVISIDYKPEERQEIPAIDLPILYEDENCVVIDKPVDVLTHSKGAFNPEATVATFVASRLVGMSGDRAGIVHRLDRATSGVIICAKNPATLKALQKQFSQRKVKKTYEAIVNGQLPYERAIIDLPIERNPKKPQTFRAGANGKLATTEYQVLQVNDKYSLVKLMPTTGRTHQLRVHLAHIGHPIVGDTYYDGEQPAQRLFLHALELEITVPNAGRKIFKSELPKEFLDKMKSGDE